VPLFTSGGLGLVILVLALRIWSCLHHCCDQRVFIYLFIYLFNNAYDSKIQCTVKYTSTG